VIRTLSFALCGVLVATAAVVHGAATHRWSMLNPDPARAAAAHAHVITLGDYRSKDIPSELPVKERSAVSCRQYTSPTGLPGVVVSITSGPPGAVSTHTPDVCYPGSGYKMLRGPKLETISLPGGGEASYMVADFEKKTATTFERQRVRWSWSVGKGWGVPDRPRFAYLREPELFKLYVVTGLAADDDRGDPDRPAVKSFVAAALSQYAGLLSGR
jgi:hypothetical protein